MREPESPHRLVALEDVLRLLDEAGPASSDALARELGLFRLDARMLLLRAHWYGLVRTSDHGEWAISDRGRELLAGRTNAPGLAAYLARLRASASRFAWRRRLRPGYIARGGVSLGLAAVVCVAGVAVASNSLPTAASPPAVAPTHVKHVRRHRRRIRVGTQAVLATTVVASRSVEPTGVQVTVTPIAAAPRQRIQVRTRRHAATSGHMRVGDWHGHGHGQPRKLSGPGGGKRQPS